MNAINETKCMPLLCHKNVFNMIDFNYTKLTSLIFIISLYDQNSGTMFRLSFFWSEILFIQVILAATEARSQGKITVALIERKPFVVLDENGTPNGLDVLIVKNFARNFNLQMHYYVINSIKKCSDELSTKANLR